MSRVGAVTVACGGRAAGMHGDGCALCVSVCAPAARAVTVPWDRLYILCYVPSRDEQYALVMSRRDTRHVHRNHAFHRQFTAVKSV